MCEGVCVCGNQILSIEIWPLKVIVLCSIVCFCCVRLVLHSPQASTLTTNSLAFYYEYNRFSHDLEDGKKESVCVKVCESVCV